MAGRRLDFAGLAAALASLARSGWLMRGIPPSIAETVADHTVASALLAMEVAWEAMARGVRVDPARAAAIALVHDLGEAWVGDIPKPAMVEGKEEAELRAIESSGLSRYLVDLYREYHARGSVEARIARAAEKLATYAVALRFRRLGYPVNDIIESSLGDALEEARAGGFLEALEAAAARLRIPLPGRGRA